MGPAHLVDVELVHKLGDERVCLDSVQEGAIHHSLEQRHRALLKIERLSPKLVRPARPKLPPVSLFGVFRFLGFSVSSAQPTVPVLSSSNVVLNCNLAIAKRVNLSGKYKVIPATGQAIHWPVLA